jgi:hypothetical protein
MKIVGELMEMIGISRDLLLLALNPLPLAIKDLGAENLGCSGKMCRYRYPG